MFARHQGAQPIAAAVDQRAVAVLNSKETITGV